MVEEPAGLEPANSSFAGCGLTNLAMVPYMVVPGAGLEPARSQ